MPKFFNSKDLDFIKTISEEVVDYVVEQAVTLFKVSVGETKTNLYGESLGKVWRAPSTLMAIVDREPMNVVYEGFGADKQQAVEFRFNIQRLRETSHSVPKIRDVDKMSIKESLNKGTELSSKSVNVSILVGIYLSVEVLFLPI